MDPTNSETFQSTDENHTPVVDVIVDNVQIYYATEITQNRLDVKGIRKGGTKGQKGRDGVPGKERKTEGRTGVGYVLPVEKVEETSKETNNAGCQNYLPSFWTPHKSNPTILKKSNISVNGVHTQHYENRIHTRVPHEKYPICFLVILVIQVNKI